MSTCSKCGVELKGHAKFCKTCGGQASLDDKKARVMSREKTWLKPTVITAVVVIVAAGVFGFTQFRANRMGARPMFSPHRSEETRAARMSQAMAVTAQNGDVLIPVKTVEDGNAHFFSYAAAGKAVTFYVMKTADGTIKTAFDACVACNHAKLGYRQEGTLVVCNNCGMGFRPEDIGKETGGCNPIPVQRSIDGQMVVLKAKDLEAGVQYF
jgi:uncharacterized membrane protein